MRNGKSENVCDRLVRELKNRFLQLLLLQVVAGLMKACL